MPGSLDGAPHEYLEGGEIPPTEDARIAFPREVLNRQHRRDGAVQRERMDEVSKARPEAPQERRDAHSHSELLGARAQHDRLDPLGNERGVAGDRRDAEVFGDPRQFP